MLLPGIALNFGPPRSTIRVTLPTGRQVTAMAATEINSSEVTVGWVADQDKWLVWSSSAPQGTGLERTTISRNRPRPQQKKIEYPFKILFLVDNNDTEKTEFWLGGDRKKPVKIYELPISNDIELYNAIVSNQGKKQKDWTGFIRWYDYEKPVYIPEDYRIGQVITDYGADGYLYDTGVTIAAFLTYSSETLYDDKPSNYYLNYRGDGYASSRIVDVWKNGINPLFGDLTTETNNRTLYSPSQYAVFGSNSITRAPFYAPSDLENILPPIITIGEPYTPPQFLPDIDDYFPIFSANEPAFDSLSLASAGNWLSPFSLNTSFTEAVKTGGLSDFYLTEYRCIVEGSAEYPARYEVRTSPYQIGRQYRDPWTYLPLPKPSPSDDEIWMMETNPPELYGFTLELLTSSSSTINPPLNVTTVFKKRAECGLSNNGGYHEGEFIDSCSFQWTMALYPSDELSRCQLELRTVTTDEYKLPILSVSKDSYGGREFTIQGRSSTLNLSYPGVLGRTATTAEGVDYIDWEEDVFTRNINVTKHSANDETEDLLPINYDYIYAISGERASFSIPYLFFKGKNSEIMAIFEGGFHQYALGSKIYRYSERYILYFGQTEIEITDLGELSIQTTVNGITFNQMDVQPWFDTLKGNKIYRVEDDSRLLDIKSKNTKLRVTEYEINEEGAIIKGVTKEYPALSLKTNGTIWSASYF